MNALRAISLGLLLCANQAQAEDPLAAMVSDSLLELLKPFEVVMAAASAELEAGLTPEPAMPASEDLFQAFLVAPPTIEPLGPQPGVSTCGAVIEEKRLMTFKLNQMREIRQEAERLLRQVRRGAGDKIAAKDRFEATLSALRERADTLRAYFDRINQAAPDRVYTYFLRLQGKRARSLEAYYETTADVKLLRVRFAARRWMDFPTESYSVAEGLQGPPTLEPDGLTWRLKRNLSAYQACTKNLTFALEFLTRWRPRPGTPGEGDRGITVRTHAWVYGR